MPDFDPRRIQPDFVWHLLDHVDPVPWLIKDLADPMSRELLLSLVDLRKTELAAQAEFGKVVMAAQQETLERVSAVMKKYGTRVAPK